MILTALFILGGFWLGWLLVFWWRNPLFPSSKLAELPPLPTFSSSDRVAVIIPHPDDETLGMAGVMQQARSQGAEVQVVLVTDGNRRGKKAIRYQEIAAALALCGVALDNVHFLEYPDGRLRQAPDLAEKLGGFLAEFSPSVIFTTAAADTHPDHAVLGETVARLRQKQGTAPRVYYSLIHYHRFPRPLGSLPGTPLYPPLRLFRRQPHWVSYTLSEQEQVVKHQAILNYKSQLSTPFLHGLMLSFDRSNELFLTEDR